MRKRKDDKGDWRYPPLYGMKQKKKSDNRKIRFALTDLVSWIRKKRGGYKQAIGNEFKIAKVNNVTHKRALDHVE